MPLPATQLSNATLAAKLDTVATGWHAFITFLFSWASSTANSVTWTDPDTLVEHTVLTPHKIIADYDSLLGTAGSRLDVLEADITTVEGLVADASQAQTIFNGLRDTIIGYKDAAATSASQAATSASAAASSATGAQQSKAAAETAAGLAEISKTGAGNFNTAAGISAAAAQASQTAAAASAAAAAASAGSVNSTDPTFQTMHVTGVTTFDNKIEVVSLQFPTSLISVGAADGLFAFETGSHRLAGYDGATWQFYVTVADLNDAIAAWTLPDYAVTNAKLAQIPAKSLKGNNGAALGDANDLTVPQVNAMLGCVTTAANIGGAPNAAGFTINVNTMTLQPASASFGGVVTTGVQSFAGAKTFTGNIAAANFSGTHSGTSSNTNSGDVTFTNVGIVPNQQGVSLSGQVLTLQPANATFPGVVSTAAQSFVGLKTFTSGLTSNAVVTVTAGGINVTGNSTITGTLQTSSTFTVTAGGIAVTGNSSITGTLQTSSTITITAGGINVTGDSTITGAVSVSKTLDLPNTTSTVGAVRINGVVVMHAYAAAGQSRNIWLGGAGNFTTTTGAMIGIGEGAMASAGTGNGNSIAIGFQSMYSNQTGHNCVSVGFQALLSNTAGYNNVAIGTLALNATTGTDNTGIGRDAGKDITSGSFNAVFGSGAQLPSATGNGQLSIQNIIYGFGNTGTGATNSTGRITVGQSIDDGVTRLQVNGGVKATGFGSTLVNKGVLTSTAALDFTSSFIQAFQTTSATNCTISFTAPNNPGMVYVRVTAPASGTTPTLTWPATVKGTPPVNVTLAKVSLLHFLWDGTNYWYVGGVLNA